MKFIHAIDLMSSDLQIFREEEEKETLDLTLDSGSKLGCGDLRKLPQLRKELN